MTDTELYAGEDFALLMTAYKDDGVTLDDLTDYDITAQLITSIMGDTIIASTDTASPLKIIRKGVSTLAVNISNKLTTTLSEGIITLTVMMAHRPTGVQIIGQTKTIEVKRSKLKKI